MQITADFCAVRYGWILPDGQIHACAPNEHRLLAAALWTDLFRQQPADAELAAERHGWIKLTKLNGLTAMIFNEPTADQQWTLLEWCRHHSIDPAQYHLIPLDLP